MKLGEVLLGAELFVDGDWVESKDQDPAGDVRLLQLADVGVGCFLNRSRRFMTSDAARRLRCTYLNPGDLLVARMPDPLGRACRLPDLSMPCVTVVDVCVIRPDLNKVCAQWLMHWMNSPETMRFVARAATGTTRSRVSRGNLAKLPIRLPPIKEQRRIAAVLDAADSLRAKRRQAIAKLDTLTQAIFIDMFGADARESAFPVRRLGEVVATTSGGTPDRSVGANYGGDIPWVKSGELRAGFVDSTGELLTEIGLASSSAKLMPIGTVLLAMYGATVGAVATLGIDAATNQAVCCLSPNNDLQTDYLAAFLRSRFDFLVSGAVGGAQPNISQSIVRSMPVPVPPIADQECFAKRSMAVRNRRRAMAKHLDAVDSLFASLQQRAFRGEL